MITTSNDDVIAITDTTARPAHMKLRHTPLKTYIIYDMYEFKH